MGGSVPLPVEAHAIRELAELQGALHDWWIDLDALTYNERAGEVTVPLEAEGRRLRFGGEGSPEAFSAQLLVCGVRTTSVEDPERIGSYTINTFEAVESSVTLIAEPNVRITFDVDRVEIYARLARAVHIPTWSEGG